jgi:hypothetical protein
LEIKGYVSNNPKSEDMEHHFHMARDNFFMFLEDLAYSSDLAKFLSIPFLPLIQTFLKISSILRQKKNLYLQKTAPPSFLVTENTVSYFLGLIGTYVIRS